MDTNTSWELVTLRQVCTSTCLAYLYLFTQGIRMRDTTPLNSLIRGNTEKWHFLYINNNFKNLKKSFKDEMSVNIKGKKTGNFLWSVDSPNVRIWINTLYNLQYCRSTEDRAFRSERQQMRLIHRFSREATTISCTIYQDMNDRVTKLSLLWCVALPLLPYLSSSNHLFRLHGHQPQQTGPANPISIQQLLGIPHLWDLISTACPRSVPLPPFPNVWALHHPSLRLGPAPAYAGD